MCIDAESRRLLTVDGDSRVTCVELFIRRSYLDELPQLWHILRTGMSLIGPRPEPDWAVQQAARQIPGYHLRHLVPSGLTGWAQIHLSYTSDPKAAAKKLAFDLYDVKNLSPSLDLQIVWRTTGLLVTGNGSR